jgi:hypothetical protein
MLAAIRRPERMRAVALIGLCLLAGLAFATCIRAVARKWPAARRSGALLAMAMAVALYWSARTGWPLTRGTLVLAVVPPDGGYPLDPTIGPDDPLVIALRRGQGPVLELPASAKGSGIFRQARAMYTGLWHWRPLLNGYASYWPAGFDARMAIAQRLPDPQALRILRDETGLTTIVVRLDELERGPRAAWEAALLAPRNDFVSKQRVGQLVIIDIAPPAMTPESPPAD